MSTTCQDAFFMSTFCPQSFLGREIYPGKRLYIDIRSGRRLGKWSLLTHPYGIFIGCVQTFCLFIYARAGIPITAIQAICSV
jgi:hypothetical protein